MDGLRRRQGQRQLRGGLQSGQVLWDSQNAADQSVRCKMLGKASFSPTVEMLLPRVLPHGADPQAVVYRFVGQLAAGAQFAAINPMAGP